MGGCIGIVRRIALIAGHETNAATRHPGVDQTLERLLGIAAAVEEGCHQSPGR
jgi:hypothetical protein